MRRCLKGLGGFPTSTDGFILGPPHGIVGRLEFFRGETYRENIAGEVPAPHDYPAPHE